MRNLCSAGSSRRFHADIRRGTRQVDHWHIFCQNRNEPVGWKYGINLNENRQYTKVFIARRSQVSVPTHNNTIPHKVRRAGANPFTRARPAALSAIEGGKIKMNLRKRRFGVNGRIIQRVFALLLTLLLSSVSVI